MSLLSLSKKILSRDKKPAKTATKKPFDKASASAKASADKQGKAAGKAGQKKTKDTPEKEKPSQGTETVSPAAMRVGLFPILSEKSIGAQERSTVVFRVLPSATKHQIATAVKEKYGVRVIKIRTANAVPKERRRGLVVGRTNYWKKAYVTVDDINPIMK